MTAFRAEAGPLEEGAKAYEKGAYETALRLFTEAQLEDPENPEVLYNMGNAYYKTGDYQSAYEYFREAERTKDKSLKQKTVYNMGNTRFRQGKFKEAIEHYKQALEIDPEDKNAEENIDFVKKMMAQQQNRQNTEDGSGDKDNGEAQSQPSSQESGDQGKDNDRQSGPQERQDAAGNEDQAGRGESPQFGDKMPQDNQKAAQETGGTDAMSSQDKQDGMAASENVTAEHNCLSRQQMERVLNRLKDRPGQAAVPSSRGQTVDQDW